MSGRLEGIWLKRARRGPMDAHETAELIQNHGLAGNADVRRTRQVTVIEAERWADVCRELGAELDPRFRRANLMVSGVDLARSRGKTLVVGDARISIRGETRPCRLMDDQHPGLEAALAPDWRGGVYGVVETGGKIAVGAPVRLEG